MAQAPSRSTAITLPARPESAAYARRARRDLDVQGDDVTEMACLLYGLRLPRRRKAPAADPPAAEPGRGLGLMHTLSAACGVARIADGKRIWFHITADSGGVESLS